MPALYLLSCAAVFAAAPPSLVDASWRDKLRTEGSAAYQAYRAQADQLTESSVIHLPEYDKPERERTVRITTFNKGKRTLFERTVTHARDGVPHTDVVCTNEEYQFSTVKTGDSPHRLTEFVPRASIEGAAGSNFNVQAYHLLESAVHAVAGENGHVLKSVQWDADRQLLKVRWRRPDRFAKTPLQEDCEIWIDPARKWQIVESTVSSPRHLGVYVIRYGEAVDGLYYPVGFTYDSTFHQGRVKGSSTYDVELSVARTTRPDDGFRLSAFGFPEPGDPPAPTPRSRTPWLLVGGSAACALGLIYLARRRRSARPPMGG